MTITSPKPNLLDKILSFVGKKRRMVVPKGVYKKYGPYVFAQARRESFWKALLRPKDATLHKGVVGIDTKKEAVKGSDAKSGNEKK